MQAGARRCRYILLRLPLETSALFQAWLNKHFPARADKVMSIIRQSRGGKDYDSAFGSRMTGTGQFAALLHQRWQIASRKRLGKKTTGFYWIRRDSGVDSNCGCSGLGLLYPLRLLSPISGYIVPHGELSSPGLQASVLVALVSRNRAG